ncbi:NRPS [Tephrocybe rancida]|nr:NRPS [Tephrocybe rancida]
MANRLPGDHVYTSAQRLTFSLSVRVPYILLAISRILGTYCGASDILLAVSTDNTELFTFIRVTWDELDTWDELVGKIGQQMESNVPVTLPTIRSTLDIDYKQPPCMAMCHVSSRPSGPYQFPLTFTYNSSENQLSLTSSLKHLHPTVSSQILSQVALTIGHIETQPTTTMSHIGLPSELMSECERTRSEEGLAAAYPHLTQVPVATDFLARRSVTHPNSTALRWYPDLSSAEHEFDSISYISLHRRANQTARWLRKIGLETEDRVAVCMSRDVLFHIVMMGIMRAGGCYVPIDPDLPEERKAYIARDSDARFVITAAGTSPLSLFGHRTVFFEDTSVQTAIKAESFDEVDFATPEGLAFLLYTSGTTGNPKGCLLTNKGLSQVILALSSTAADVRMTDLSRGRYLAVACETFVPIALGMPLLSAPRSQLLENLPFYVKSLSITHLGIVPSLIEATLGAVSDDNGGADTELRYIASGGEKMSDAILDKWADHPKVRLANFYGPSEATIGCCARYMDPETPRANIGRAFANVAGYVVDANLNVLPRGGIGELVIEGPLVGRGYFGRPDLTERVFMEWPRRGDWAYRTGDLVRMMPDFTFEILGRIDSQIKLRGVRIESEGISSIIRQAVPSSSDFSLDAATILGKHPSIGAEQLVSFFTWDPSVSVATRKSHKPCVISPPPGLMSRIKSICEVELARYMRPSHIIPLSWLPLSSNGKSDAKVLAGIFHALEIDSLADLMAGMYKNEIETRPPTQTEETIFAIVRRHTTIPLYVALPELNIFTCGLDSMAVIRFAKDLFEEFGHRISASDIMTTPTLSGIASLLNDVPSSPTSIVGSYTANFSSKWSDSVRSIYAVDSVETILPPFGVQEGVLSRSADNDTMYVQHVILVLRSDTSTAGLRRAWQVIMARHPILRTVFFFDNELAQIVLSPEHLSLPWAEEQTSIEETGEFVKWFLVTHAPLVAQDINATLSNSPAFRLTSFKTQKQPFLVLSIHHALYDGISLRLLFQDVEGEYHGSTPQTVARASDILDHIAWTDLPKAQEFWLDHFEGFVWPQDLPAKAASSPTIHYTSEFQSTLSYLKELSAFQNVTLQTVLTSAFAVLAATRIYLANDISFGIIRSGRLLPVDNVETAICPMVAVVPTRINLSESDTILHNVQSRASAMVEVEHVPLGKVQKWIRPGRALFDLLFSVSVKTDVSSNIWDILESQPPEADYDLSVEVVLDPRQDTVVVQAAWKNCRLDELVVQGLINDLERTTLDIGAGNISSHLSGIPLSTNENSGNTESIDEENIEDVSDPELLIELRQIIAGFLRIDEGLLIEHVSFLTLGLDSIKSVGLARALRKLGHDIRAEEIMKYASLQMLTNHVNSSRLTCKDLNHLLAFSSAVEKIRQSFSADDFRLSSSDQVTLFPTTTLQAGMLTQTMSSKGSLYLHAFPLRILSTVSLETLEKAWRLAIEQLDILRTSFHFSYDTGLWAQAVHSFNPTRLTKDSFTTEEDYKRKLSAFLMSIKPTQESDLRTPPIWLRAFVPCSASPEEAPRLVLIMHHSLYDGLSIATLLETVQSNYLRSTERPLVQPPQFHSLLPHILDQEESGVPFWTQVLHDFHPSHIPLQSAVQSHGASSYAASRTFLCDPTILRDTLRRSAVTVQCLGQAVWGKLLAELSGSSDVVFGHTVSGRSIPDAEEVIGPVLNTIPCRVRLLDGLRNIDLLRSIHKLNVDALPWQHTSLRSIHHKMGVSRLWDSLFLFQPRFETASTNDPLWVFDVQDSKEARIQYAFAIELQQVETGFVLTAACRPDYMELEAMLLRFQKLMENLMLHLDSFALDDISMQASKAEPSPVPNAHEVAISPSIKSLLSTITSIPATSFTSITPLATLGIDSITAIQIVSRFKRAGLALSTNDIITSRTVGDMIEKVRPWEDKVVMHHPLSSLQLHPDERAAIIARIGSSPDSIEDILPTSSGMKWLIGSWQKSGRTAYQHAFAFKLATAINTSKLHDAWGSLLGRLPLLRSTFACASGSRDPRIVTFKVGSFPDSWVEEEAPEGQGLQLVAARMRDLVSSPPPTNLPPTRAILYRSSEANYLLLYLNHFQYDAWCLPLILDDLSRLYLGSEPVSTEDPRPFLQVSGPSQENLSLQKSYWQATLGDHFAPILFPSLLPQLPETHARIIYTAPAAIFQASRCADRARSLGVSLSSVFLACWARVQGSYTSSSVTLGLWQAGRSGLLDDISRLACPCLNIVPMCIPVPEGGATIEIAKGISVDLQNRSSVVVQSDLVNINQWVGAGERPLCNVVVNIVRVAPDVTTTAGLMSQVELPYYIPSSVPKELSPTIDRLATTDLIQNDLVVDFAVLHEHNTIMMSIDAGAHIMDDMQARNIVNQWTSAVRDTLDIY